MSRQHEDHLRELLDAERATLEVWKSAAQASQERASRLSRELNEMHVAAVEARDELSEARERAARLERERDGWMAEAVSARYYATVKLLQSERDQARAALRYMVDESWEEKALPVRIECRFCRSHKEQGHRLFCPVVKACAALGEDGTTREGGE